MSAIVLKGLISVNHRVRTLGLGNFSRNYAHFSQTKCISKDKQLTKHLNLHQCLYRNISNKTDLKHRHKLQLAIYVSFGIGAAVITAIVIREAKRIRGSFKGIQEMDIPAWRRFQLYKYKDVCLTEFVVNQLDDIEKFEVRPNDVWVVSFPRSGTTWLQEIVYLIHSDLDISDAQKRVIDDRFPYFEFTYPGTEAIADLPSPRLIKSHLPLNLLPSDINVKKPKIIYIARNPKDVVVSYYYFNLLLKPYTSYDGKFEEFCDLFLHDQVAYTPWWRHVLDFWNQRQEDNVLFIKYEDLQKDTASVIRTIANFLGKPLTDEQVEFIKDYCSFEKMKTNDMTNHSWFKTLGAFAEEGEFIRKGKVGDWENHLNPDLNHRLNQMISLNFQDSDLIFDYRSVETNQNTTSDLKTVQK